MLGSVQLLSALDDQDQFFGPRDVGFDWSEYDFYQSLSLMLTSTSVVPISLGASAVDMVFIRTSTPIEVDYTQDGIARIARVKPPTIPTNYFDTARSPSEAPQVTQPGVLLLTGFPISAITLKGIAGVAQQANVIVAVAGYNP